MWLKYLIKNMIKSCVFFYHSKLRHLYHEYTTLFFTQKVRREVKYCGSSVAIKGEIHISFPKSVILGNHVIIDENAFIKCNAGIVVGDNTYIGRNFTATTTPYNNEVPKFQQNTLTDNPITIGQNCSIGMNVYIAPGVTIGEGVVIHDGANITFNVSDFETISTQAAPTQRRDDVDHTSKYLPYNTDLLNTHSSLKKTAKEKGEQMFFVVTTGRSGSMTLSSVLSQHSSISCLHEPVEQLISLSTQYEHRQISQEEIQAKLKVLYCQTGIFHHHLFSGQSDQKLSNLITSIAKLLPDAKFIWLLRNGEDVVSSGYGRGWFDDAEFYNVPFSKTAFSINPKYSRSRLNGAECGFFSEITWKNMGAFERNCWYWSYWNNRIEEQISLLPEKQWMMVKLEELHTKLTDLCEFIGVPDEGLNIKGHNQANYTVLRADNWDNTQKEIFKKHCASSMKKWYNKTYD